MWRTFLLHNQNMDTTERPVITILMSDWLWLQGVRKQSFMGEFFGSEIFIFKGKIHTIPILMHQMRISTTCVSSWSVILRPKNLEIRSVVTVKTRGNQTKCQPKTSWNKVKLFWNSGLIVNSKKIWIKPLWRIFRVCLWIIWKAGNTCFNVMSRTQNSWWDWIIC
jgi:hypothetical protein